VADLESGTYTTSRDKVVIVWQAPDKDGTGDEVWYNRTDSTGREVGRERLKDKDGNVVRKYPMPDGFQNRPSFDNTDNYVLMQGNEPFRNANGEAVSIKPGEALVMYPDGRTETLKDEYERYVFAKSHEKVSSSLSLDRPVPDDEIEEDDQDEADDKKEAEPAKKAAIPATPATVKAGAK
jgi:hypothetical protein